MTTVLGCPIPDALVRSSQHWGESGGRWLHALPSLVDELVEKWGLTPELPLYPDGQCSIVVRVTTNDGERGALKVQWPHREATHEIDALLAYDGRGAVRVLEVDRERNAFVLERCEPGTNAWTAGDPDEVIRVSTDVMRRLWRPANGPFTVLAQDGLERAEKIRRAYVEHDGPFDADLAEEGAKTWEEMASSQPDVVLLHGDFHPYNVLRAEREPWLAVDPKPLLGDPAFDTAQLLLNFRDRQWPLDESVAALASMLELDRHRIWTWYFGRTVEEITWSLGDGKPIDKDLETARLVAQLRE